MTLITTPWLTCEELDVRLKGLYSTYKTIQTSFNPIIVWYTTALHQLLLSEGFCSTYKPTDSTQYQDIWLYMLPDRGGLVTVSVKYDGWLYIDCGSDVPLIPSEIRNGPAPITTLVATLHETAQLILELPPCRTCH